MNRFFSAVLDLLFPPRCPFCGKVLGTGEGKLCAGCQRELPWLLENEAEQKLEFVSLCVSPLRYQGRVRESVHRYKFGGVEAYAGVYGSLVAQCVEDHLALRWDVVSWVPLARRRLRKRGYDQARLLAEAAARRLGAEAVPLLEKRRDTGPQSGIEGKAPRRANVLGAYVCTGPAEGKRVLLIDDVVTTGATLSECARMLRMAGAEDVVCATLARAR